MPKTIASHYNKIAKEYTKVHGYEEKLSLPSLEKFINFLPKGGIVLDIGCGGGQDSKFFKDNGFDVLGIDLSREMIKLAKIYSPQTSFKVIDLMKLESHIKYDGIWCSRVFHNISVSEQTKFLKKIKSLLKKNGLLYLTSVVSNKDIEDMKDGILIKRLSSKSFKELLLKNGFKIIKFRYWEGKRGMEIFATKI